MSSQENDIHCLIETEVYNTHFTKYYVYFDRSISSPDNYRNLFKILRDASSSDLVHFIFNCCGGQGETSAQITQYISDCKAYTIAEVHVARSAAINLFLACDDIQVFDFSEIMIHNPAIYYNYDKAVINRDIKRFEHIKKMQKVMDEKYLTKIFTDDEIASLDHGDVCIWLYGDELRKRIEKYQQQNGVK